MADRSAFALNRITCPALSLDRFFALAARVGIEQVELRNDLPGGKIIDDLSPQAVVELAKKHGVRIITINALQKFNLGALRARVVENLESLIATSKAIGCDALVLCPNNDVEDRRSPSEVLRDTVDALKSFASRLVDAGMVGLVEPLGFPECSLRSKLTAIDAIKESGAACYRIVYDTFHHAIGPDAAVSNTKSIDVGMIGLVHLSGVEAAEPRGGYRDEHRVLISGADRIRNREQVGILRRDGYRGTLSFEPFATSVHELAPDSLARAIEASMQIVES